MSIDRRLVNLGLFLLILGAIPLAVHQGWLPRDTLGRAWELWPLILVGIGVGLVMRRTPLEFAGGLIVAATFGTMFGALLAGVLSLGALGCGNASGAAGPAVLDDRGTFAGGTGTVVLRATCASLSVSRTSGAGWGVTVSGSADVRPILAQAPDRVEVRSPDGANNVAFTDERRSRWSVVLGADSAYTIDASVSAGDETLDLGGLRVDTLTVMGNAIGSSRLLLHDASVGRLDVQVNAADLTVGLPAEVGLTGRIQANAASVKLCADPGTGLRLRNGSTLTSDNFAAAGLVRSGSTWESPALASAGHVVDLDLEGAAVRFTLNDSEGCQ
jgi:hypothetical protein